MKIEPRLYNRFIKNGGNATPKHACADTKVIHPTTGLALLWACKPFTGNFIYWQVSQEESEQRKIH
jgi:hypothetical protein